jgi:hypothetical protein
MNKKIMIGLLVLFFTSAATAQIEEANRILDDIAGLVSNLSNFITQYNDKIKPNIAALKALKWCAMNIKIQKKKPSELMLPGVKDKQGNEVPCSRYVNVAVPAAAISVVLSFVRDQLIGSEQQKGIMYVILDILAAAGLKDQVSKVQAVDSDIVKIIDTLDKMLRGLATQVKVEQT